MVVATGGWMDIVPKLTMKPKESDLFTRQCWSNGLKLRCNLKLVHLE